MLIVEDRDTIRRLTLESPERRNAIAPDEWAQLAEIFVDFENSDQRVLVVTGAGEDFCSGADLSGDREPGLFDRFEAMSDVNAAVRALHATTKPTIAAVDGVAVGAGMNLALGCDIVVATTRARFAEIFVKRGLTVDFGGTWLLPRLVGLQRAKELALSGRVVGGIEAAEIGLALEAVDPANLADRVHEMAEQFSVGAPLAQAFIKQGLHQSSEMTMDQALTYEAHAQAMCLSSADAMEGFRSFLEKRAPKFRGR